jgi:hypothetical protein
MFDLCIVIPTFQHAHKEEYSKNDNNDLQKHIAELEQMLKVVTSSSGSFSHGNSLHGNLFAKGQSRMAKTPASTGNLPILTLTMPLN